MRNPFHTLATYIVHRLGLGSTAGGPPASSALRLPGSNEKLSRELMELGGGRKNCVESYYVKKIESFLEIAALCLAVLIAVVVYEHQQDRSIENGILERPGYGESAKEQSLILTIGGTKASQAGEAQQGSSQSGTSQIEGSGAMAPDPASSRAWKDEDAESTNGVSSVGVTGSADNAGKSSTASHTSESESIDVRLDARTYTSKQVQSLLKDAVDKLETSLPGENKTLDEVRLPFSLPASLEDGAVSVEYYITPGGMIEEDGSICGKPDPEGSLVRILATLTCQDKNSTYECAARIYPPILTEEEQLRENIRNAVAQAGSSDPSGSKVKLPDSVDGRTLHWSYPKDSSLTLIILLMLILPVAFWAREDSKIHDAAKERLSQLELDYSQLLWKLTMLLSAGLTIRGAFTRIVDQYEAEKAEAERQLTPHAPTRSARNARDSGASIAASRSAKHTGRRYVYEEMILTLREMRSGVPEASAYENFGRRCSLPTYIKLGSLLSQNLKKGSKGLTALLEHEAVLSMDQHKMAVRKLGERASVKMLLPMILMFGVVLIILMVPAFLSM